MKTIALKFFGVMMLIGASFIAIAQTPISVTTPADPAYTIVDLNTGQTLDVYYDTLTWKTINRTNNSPVDFYVVRYDEKTSDTVHGVTGLVVNSMITQKEGKWDFNDARVKWDGEELKVKDRYGRKVKWEKGKLKIKDWNSKFKSEGNEAKYKEEWDKIKWKEGEVKIEEGTKKEKIRQ
jgi:hypothetical protein